MLFLTVNYIVIGLGIIFSSAFEGSCGCWSLRPHHKWNFLGFCYFGTFWGDEKVGIFEALSHQYYIFGLLWFNTCCILRTKWGKINEAVLYLRVRELIILSLFKHMFEIKCNFFAWLLFLPVCVYEESFSSPPLFPSVWTALSQIPG